MLGFGCLGEFALGEYEATFTPPPPPPPPPPPTAIGSVQEGYIALLSLQNNMIALLPPQNMIALIRSDTVSRANDLTPAIDAVTEVKTAAFDFGAVLNPGVSITSVLQMTCSVLEGNQDSTPAARLIGAFAIGQSPYSDAPAQAVYQKVGQMVDGTVYRLLCQVQTSDGQQPQAWTHITCKAPN
jgi:hypothetical protein